METKIISLNGDTFRFELKHGNVSGHGFYHTCTLYRNGTQVARDRVQYLNRTWEAYRFQTVMLCCARKINNEELISKLEIS